MTRVPRRSGNVSDVSRFENEARVEFNNTVGRWIDRMWQWVLYLASNERTVCCRAGSKLAKVQHMQVSGLQSSRRFFQTNRWSRVAGNARR